MRIESVTRLLTDVALALRSGQPGAGLDAFSLKETLLAHYHPEAGIRPEVIILAGKGGRLSRKQKEEWAPFLHQMLSGFEGTVISGGTNSGIPGLAGEMALTYLEQGKKAFNLIGYLPEKLPDGAGRSPGYDQFMTSPAQAFSLEDILNYWVDILFHGIIPEHVLLAGMDGGPLALSEYRLALSLGAKVTLLKDSGGSVKKFREDPYWSTLPNLMLVGGEGKITP
jgi:hypothetical protein